MDSDLTSGSTEVALQVSSRLKPRYTSPNYFSLLWKGRGEGQREDPDMDLRRRSGPFHSTLGLRVGESGV